MEGDGRQIANGQWNGQRAPDTDSDRYLASIELSNRCREFYNSRLEAAQSMKTRWNSNQRISTDSNSSHPSSSSGTSYTAHPKSQKASSPVSAQSSSSLSSGSLMCDKKRPQRNSIDVAMEKLRTEMMSLMEQDLSLMKQLLTLNEAIEDLKTQRAYCSSFTSGANSRNLDSDWSISDTEMYESEDDVSTNRKSIAHWVDSNHVTRRPSQHDTCVSPPDDDFCNEDHRISLSSLTRKINSMSLERSSDSSGTDTLDSRISDTPLPVQTYKDKQCGDFSSVYTKRDTQASSGRTITIHHDREQNSFDSGIHDLTADEENVVWAV